MNLSLILLWTFESLSFPNWKWILMRNCVGSCSPPMVAANSTCNYIKNHWSKRVANRINWKWPNFNLRSNYSQKNRTLFSLATADYSKTKFHTEPRKTGGTANTSIQVAIVLGFHVINCEVGASFRDQSTNHVIPNNLPNSLEYLYYVTVVQLSIVVDNFDANH